MSSYNYLLSLSTVNHKINKRKYKKNPFALSLTVNEVQFRKYHNCTTHSCPSLSISSTSSASNCWIFLPAKQYQTLNSRTHTEDWGITPCIRLLGTEVTITFTLQLVYLQEKSCYCLDNRFSSTAITDRDAMLNTSDPASKWTHCLSLYWMTDW